MSRLRVAIVGAGGWGEQHARALAARDDVELVGFCARTWTRVRARAERHRARAYVDIGEMLVRERPDLVFLSLPNREHLAPTLAVIEAGVPLVVEKPLAFGLDEGERLIAAARARGLFFAINFNHRFARALELARDAVGSGRIGDIVYASWRFGGEGGACEAHDNLIETQCHGFDQLEWLCGPIRSLAMQAYAPTGRGPSTVALTLGFAGGAVGTMLGSYDASYAQPATHRLEIGGTRGRIVVEDTVRRLTISTHGSEHAEVWEPGYFNDRDRSFHQTMDRHLDAILRGFRAGAPPPVPAEAGLRALTLAHAAIRSQREGRVVAIDEVRAAGRG
ncbi:MAG TPA: Gfo/Idh/MocA family oxidoreductase [Planctomycetota bacterium]|nr:Gfo/Idh/MocA family oxidoreductase [Planctomycetota bacterium]